ncbi:terminase small subunit [Caldimonas thermodepolymerans]|uniref:Phage terminase Nu1 subunit (DNA packaging protein) n=1 Tax=Caldimonas thermodepolymerans TaxID=215580 RepID=A0AA46DDS4_9BURK|nr:terminase small subunit [Caldimonas thermodepolymerans]TCP06576.1 phage terminase Nu1 subunit (DNA packaging protein) [Caldimonas thermodepolymerans]UZG49367.1 terminase small subunit [Caldimonas thermodepolymerans]
MNLAQPITQAEFAQLVGISEAKVSQLVSEGVLVRGESGQAWLHAYCGRLREMAAGRMSESGGLDLVQERARLAREQADAVAMKNKIMRKEYAPVSLLSEVLASASQALAAKLEALPMQLKRASRNLSADDIAMLEREVARARNEWVEATSSLDLALGAPSDEDDEPAAAQEVD